MSIKSFLLTVMLVSLEVESFGFEHSRTNSVERRNNEGRKDTLMNPSHTQKYPHTAAKDSTSKANLQTLGGCFNSKGQSKLSIDISSWNTYLEEVKPGAVVTPSTESEISQIIKCASQLNSTVSVKSGGHSYEGYWRGNPGGIVIDLKNMNKLEMTDRGTIKVNAGSLLGPVIAKLVEESKNTEYTYALPHGLQPVIGMGGQTLGGGFGLLSRKYGLLTDKVVNMKMVNSKGDIVQVNKKENPELFTALRGAGAGSFGVVTEFEFEYVKLPKKLTVARLTWSTNSQNFTTVWDTIMDYYNNQDDVGVAHYVNFKPGGEIEMGATFSHDSAKDQMKSYNKMVNKLNPDIRVQESHDFVKAFSFYAGLAGKDGDLTIQKLQETKPETDGRYFKGRSGYFAEPLKNKSKIDELGALLTQAKNTTGFFLLINLYGGNIRNEDCQAPTSFVHRNIFASSQIGATSKDPISTNLAKKVYSLLKPYFPQAYQNYMDKGETNFMTTYYGHMAPFLVEVKNKWDPTNLFKFERSIPFELSQKEKTILKTIKPTSLLKCNMKKVA